MEPTIDRREFVRLGACIGAVTALSLAVGCSSAETADPDDSAIETPSFEYGEETGMSKRVLVGYATRTGSTTGVAEAIGRTLSERGYAVHVKPLREKPSPGGYDAVVVGSAINGAAWLPEAIGWVESNTTVLGDIPTAVFCVHSMNGGGDEKQTRKRLAYLEKVRAAVTPAAEGFFLGKGPTADDSSLIARWAFKTFGGTAEGDARDWNKIKAWAESLDL
ncbi:MAG: flavodoxin [Coriobacteriia bacterium]|nr:flavodoxin [Coriobacteriia bacterium]MBN2839380.1 flavodoxin [Coriobacteriia bacterium]